MKVVLINSPIVGSLSTPQEKGPFSDIGENLGLGYIAAILREHDYEVELIDCYLEERKIESIVEYVKKIDPIVVAFSVPSIAAIPITKKIIASLREQKVKSHITAGGHYITVAYKKVLEQVGADSLILFEGEYTMLELVKKIESGGTIDDVKGLVLMKEDTLIVNPLRPFIEDLDALPFPSRDHLKQVLEMQGYASISTCRGCYGKCIFCSASSFYGSIVKNFWRPRSAENVVDELQNLIKYYGVDKVIFVDDSFIGVQKKGEERAAKIAKEIIKRGLKIKFLIMCRPEEVSKDVFALLKEAGLVAASIGIESGAQSGLDRLRRNSTVEQCRNAVKILKDLKIEVFVGVIPFDPWTTMEELKETLNLLKDIGELSIGSFRKRMMCLDGTTAEKMLRDENRLNAGKYKIAENKTEVLCSILERAGAKWGNKINCIMYLMKWERSLADNETENCKKNCDIADRVLTLASNQILEQTIAFVDREELPPTSEIEFFIRELEQKLMLLYESLVIIKEKGL
ncbi:radical SAM superfamily enzyme YgiQ (UPF0313 family) [Ruminiclostridium sufflavum DSM 19573]|uniref:Radical SAM superfamily enzyme YgiQ (UPF0313 family) n=1 Tax=Ruminiclostridium sufflavum DSM 19573 TaxID=1121337 RepID=A0A318XYS8_9FIRM|nr:radical SAM protein [Ruminiclostridium sufflavum]PYG88017.1 radical SAM superfamily enzyme YgiQ (UPF0313 family) [Ruminiclostridium sufflavum DSM 19573]